METKLKKLVIEGLYQEAEELIVKSPSNIRRDLIMNLAYDTERIAIYSFLIYISGKNKTQFWLELIIDIMINPLCFIEGAYSVALFHTRELLKVDSSVKNMERLLFFHDIPEKLVEDTEAELVTREIIRIEPNNRVANCILK